MRGATCCPPVYRDPEKSTELLPEYPVAPVVQRAIDIEKPAKEHLIKQADITTTTLTKTIEITPA